jgi:hypothetical protein
MSDYHTTINKLASEYDLDKIIGVYDMNNGLYFLPLEDVINRYVAMLDTHVIFEIIDNKILIDVTQ